MNRLRNGQILFAFGLVVLNTVYASQLLKMALPFANGEPGTSFLPTILCIFVYITIAWIIYSEFQKPQENLPDLAQSDAIPRIDVLGPVFAIGLISLFIIGFFYAGYIVSAAVYTFLIALYFNYEQNGVLGRSILTALVTAIVVTVFGWLFFVKLFGLYLPVWEF